MLGIDLIIFDAFVSREQKKQTGRDFILEVNMLKEILINGLRGFSVEKNVKFAIPNGKKGSGLTILVGGNNTGKTTISEAIKYFNFDVSQITFSVGKRNQQTGKRVNITYIDESDKEYSIYTKDAGGCQVETNADFHFDVKRIPFVLPSRRSVQYEMGGGFYDSSRWDYTSTENSNNKVRKPTIDYFQQRIFRWGKHKEEFNNTLYKILDADVKWYIDQMDNGNYYLAFQQNDGGIHTSEGIGDGIWSIFTIADALYDFEENSIIVIDEPELSLHPQYQKRVMNLLLEESSKKQIIISTHSPYFISWEALENGGVVNRTFKNKQGNIEIKTLNDENAKFICKTIKDKHNPHLWGMDAKEIFFLEDNIVVVEGQEDVVAYEKIINELECSINASFFGWGAGGAEKIVGILKILANLGYQKVMAIYDGDKCEEYERCKKEFPQYEIIKIWKDDIRDKKARTTKEKEGILDEHFAIKKEFKEKMKSFLSEINNYFSE